MNQTATKTVPPKKIPAFYGFALSVDEQYDAYAAGKLYRMGIKVNTPDTCNWACPYCYVGSPEYKDRPRIAAKSRDGWDNPYKNPNWGDDMRGWIDQGVEMGVRAITINGTFEPLTAPHLMDVIRHAKKRELFVTLVTNGGLMTDALLGELKALEIGILTKMNAPMVESDDPLYEDYAQIQKILSGQPGDARKIYEQQKALIRKLVEAGFNTSPKPGQSRLGVESVIAMNNIKHLPRLVRQLRELNIYSHIEVIKDQGFAQRNPIFQVGREDLKELFYTVLEQDVAAGYERWEPKVPYLAGTCYQNLVRVDVLADGTIRPCPGVEMNVGNLYESSLKEILQTPAVQTVRNLETLIEGDCASCDLFKARTCYGGCRGTVFQTLKKRGFSERECLVASDPSCWRVKKVLDDGTTVDDVYGAAEPVAFTEIKS